MMIAKYNRSRRRLSLMMENRFVKRLSWV